MMEQVFFVVDGQELIMDKVLVEFDGSPVFFVCKNKNVYFIALNIDLDEERYILTRISLNRLSRMLHGKITMRESILKGDKYWDIVAGADVDKDIVYERNIEEIPLEVLPYEGAYFKIASKDMAAYTEKIDSILYGEDDWENEAVQECVECIEELVRNLTDQFEIIIQQVCENVIKDMKIHVNYNFRDGDYSEEICKSKVEIKKVNIKTDIDLQDNKNFPFAA